MHISHPNIDAIVVGTGPGGASTARELARAGSRVLLLEQGGAALPAAYFLERNSSRGFGVRYYVSWYD